MRGKRTKYHNMKMNKNENRRIINQKFFAFFFVYYSCRYRARIHSRAFVITIQLLISLINSFRIVEKES